METTHGQDSVPSDAGTDRPQPAPPADPEAANRWEPSIIGLAQRMFQAEIVGRSSTTVAHQADVVKPSEVP
jgi:hypothetical protein